LTERFHADESHSSGVIDCRWLRTSVYAVPNILVVQAFC